MELGPIEKWMQRNLGVERLPMKGGSGVIYRHEALTCLGDGLGHFSVHVMHNKNREFVTKFDYKKYIHANLMLIISIIESKGAGCE